MIYVFGSNLAGNHNSGVALIAATEYGAIPGVGEGISGNSYALPILDKDLQPRPLAAISVSANRFIDFAQANPDVDFSIAPFGWQAAIMHSDRLVDMLTESSENCKLADPFSTNNRDIEV